jgi:hypothetical protein
MGDMLTAGAPELSPIRVAAGQYTGSAGVVGKRSASERCDRVTIPRPAEPAEGIMVARIA